MSENTFPPAEDERAEAEAQHESGDSAEQSGAEQSGAQAAELIEKLNAENQELKNKLLLTAADMENLRKRTEREKSDAKTYAVSAFARDMLTIADNLSRALSALPAEAAADPKVKSLAEGVEMTERALAAALQNHGVRKIETLGKKFDPHLHQAMFEAEDKSVPHNTVSQELQPGYTIGGRVLRAAQVGVAKGGEKHAAKAEEAK